MFQDLNCFYCKKRSRTVPTPFWVNLLVLINWRYNIPTYIPKIRWNIVTIQGRFILLHHRACGFGYPFGPQALQLTIWCYPQNVFALPPKLRGGSHSEVECVP